MITLENLVKAFGTGNAPVVDDVSLSVPAGAFLVLLGPSGCGKSTLLRMLAGLENPTRGTIRFGDTLVASASQSLPAGQRGVGLVFQSYALWPHMTVAGNVDWPLKVSGLDPAIRRIRVAEALDLVGIADLAGRYPAEISGGQQQRVALARMIAPRPQIMLFDEPLSNLDASLRVEMRHELTRLHAATGATTVYVTHDQVEAMTMASHVAVLNRGRIEQFGRPGDLLTQPATAFVARFVGTPPANLVPVQAGAWLGLLPDPALRGATGLAMVRAQDWHLSGPGPRSLPAQKIEVVPLAGRLVVTCKLGDQRVTVIAEPEAPLPADLHLALPEAPYALFNIEGQPLP
ncbi:ABC transporter ATP-binding protein [Fertoebacter nigrum]|uniref:ABC transporter ATP-binding protein n=1 Tax=Fertoeibacter niger TaxID=2656921 RepID=A0A8X8H1Q5_9RHOB|nr:ABC transporter ATP-binding protein [Fertoeibacter niger]NUB45958.1 ABC transporter ATP-binding protein [Fertoeibacter niger]